MITLSFCVNNSETLKILKEKKKAVVLGIGVSNLPLINILCDMGIEVTACDKKDLTSLSCADKLQSLGVKLSLGDNYLSALDSGDFVIFRSPGIRPDIKEISSALDRGCVLSSEMELFFEVCPAKIIGVTGSDGKTTTTTLIYKMLSLECEKRKLGQVFVGGNIGSPLLPLSEKMTENDFAVVELSSFQLMTMTKSPLVSVITNISPNHLNWHIDMEEYKNAKFNIFSPGNSHKLTVNFDCEETAELLNTPGNETVYFSSFPLPKDKSGVYLDGKDIIMRKDGVNTPIMSSDDIIIPGKHNVQNYMAAISAVSDYVSIEAIKQIATTFTGVEHRCEFVREVNGVRFYNSSIDSSPTRTAAALSSFNGNVVVIIGGRDKHLDLAPLAETLCARSKVAILTGESTKMVEEALEKCHSYHSSGLKAVICDDFENAVITAYKEAAPGDVVILSPAFTSFDRFNNFEERGRLFKKIVNEII
ncbi:MAG: UDP-N-acetylmuramoyl-L-alanine--D-glutamate ligase [Clostridia bacterium]|nr:UDP-N-acetylmuramoyl-L-alanine--D-glutamate ligase [Clostridia bacterium]